MITGDQFTGSNDRGIDKTAPIFIRLSCGPYFSYYSYFSLLFCCAPTFPYFLAHLSRRLTGELIGYPWIRRPSVFRLSTFSNIFSSETAWPIKAKFYVEPPWEGGTKVAATPIYGKNPSKIIFSRTGGPIFTKLGM